MLSALYVHEGQKGNPVLSCIKNVKWEYSKDIVPDYVTAQTCVLFVSVNYHTRHPAYIVKRINDVGKNFRLRILLVLVDNENNPVALQELNKLAFRNDFTLILAWSNLECARYIETLKSYEGKSAASIQEKEETEYLPRVTKVLTNIRSVNKTDVVTLLDVFGNLGNICQATEQQLILCPGIGEKKVKRLHQTLHEPFKKKKTESITSSGNNTSSSMPYSQRHNEELDIIDEAGYEAMEEMYGKAQVVTAIEDKYGKAEVVADVSTTFSRTTTSTSTNSYSK